MLLDRWLVVVFQEGCYELWDLFPDDADSGCAGLSPKGSWGKKREKGRVRVRPVCVLQERVHGAFISSAACVDSEDEAIVLALSSQVSTLSSESSVRVVQYLTIRYQH